MTDDPLSPSFPVEKKKDTFEVSTSSDDFGVSKATADKVRDILLNHVPNETPINHISVGSKGNKGVDKRVLTYYNPHNCRVYYKYSIGNNKGMFPVERVGYSLVNSSEHLFKKYLGAFNICVKKIFIEVRPLNNRYYVLEFDKPELVEAEKERIKVNLLQSCTDALKAFVSEFPVSCDFVIDHFRILERKYTGDAITEAIPKDVMFRVMHAGKEIAKKVYMENNLEVSDGISDLDGNAFHANHVRNLLIKDIAPDIAESISVLAKEVADVKPMLTSSVSMAEVLSSIKALAAQNLETAQGLNGLVTLLKAQQPKLDEDIIPKERPDYVG